jgi:glycosyltransferase involved in cell wall biosynthesis
MRFFRVLLQSASVSRKLAVLTHFSVEHSSPSINSRTMSNSTQDTRPGLAMIGNVLAPYRVHLHKLIAAGIPELKLHTLVTHGPADFEWKLHPPESIRARFFGSPDDSPLAGTLRRPIAEWQKGGRLIEYLKQNDIRAVILFGYRYISYLRTIRYCDAAGLPLFVNNDSNIHGDRRLSPTKRWLKKLVYAWWLQRVSGVMSMGAYGDQFFTYYGVDPGRLYRVPYTPDYEFFARVDRDQLHRFRQKFGLSAERKYILYSGRLVKHKRVDLLIDAFAAIANERPDWDLLIVGDGVLREELRRRAPEWLRTRVIWTGFLEQEELKAAYHASDVLVLPSDFEPWAVVVQEAMAAGLAVVSSDIVGAAHELIEDRRSGRIFTAGELSALVQAIEDVTRPDAIDSYKTASRAALENWRRANDPVEEIRRALTDVGILSAEVS